MGRRMPIPPVHAKRQPVAVPRHGPPPLPQGDYPGKPSRFYSDRARYGDTYLAAPVNEWIDVQSTYVNRIRFEPMYDMLGLQLDEGELKVEFVDGAMVGYPDTPARMFSDMVNSSSKGMYVNYVLKGRRYIVYSEATGGVAHPERSKPPANPITKRPWRK